MMTSGTSFSSCLTSPDDMSASSFSDSSGVRRRQWAEASSQNRDSAIFDLGVDLEAVWREDSVGVPVQLSSFANDTWQAPTPRAHAIKQVNDCRLHQCVRISALQLLILFRF